MKSEQTETQNFPETVVSVQRSTARMCAEIAEGKLRTDETGEETDMAYNDAIYDVVAAIRREFGLDGEDE